MEVLIVFGVLTLFVVLLIVRTPRRGQSFGSTVDPEQRPNQDVKSVTAPRFDAAHATHLAKPRILRGAAYVIDGDTIRIGKTQIRLFGVDAPELEHPYGKRAKWALHKLCKNQTILAEVLDEDDHGRTVARCLLSDGQDLSAEMVKLGLAIDWPKFSGGKYKHLETSDARRKLFLADARQKGRMDVWARFEAKQNK